MNNYLAKSINMDELEAILHRIIDRPMI
ncbi:hypothetical protein DSUL_50073 [Desulfovibrionales bacterium]